MTMPINKPNLAVFLSGIGVAGLLGIGVWVGEVQAELGHKVSNEEFARIDQRLDDHIRQSERAEKEVKEDFGKVDNKLDRILEKL